MNQTNEKHNTNADAKLLLGDVEIIDDYKNIPFVKIKALAELKVGMQIQIVDRNIIPLKWRWITVNEDFLIKISHINTYSTFPLKGCFIWKDKLSSDIEWKEEAKPIYNVLDWIRVINIA